MSPAPIETRSARRASGSALPANNKMPSQPNAAALRIIAPRFVGLSTASATTTRVHRDMRSSGLRSGGRRNSPVARNGTPSPVTSRRRSSVATNMSTESPIRAKNVSAMLWSHNKATGSEPVCNARSTTRSPSATKRPAPTASSRSRRLASWRSFQRNGSRRGSSTLSTLIIMGG